MRPVNHGAERPTHPLVSVADAYYRLIERLTPQAYSGLTKLYLMSQGYDRSALTGPQITTRDGLGDVLGRHYLDQVIRTNIASHLTLLSALITARIRDTQGVIPIRSSWINNDKQPRDFYSPSPFLSSRLQVLCQCAENYKVAQLTNTIGPVSREVAIEVESVVQSSGFVSANRRCDDTLLRFIRLYESMLDQDRSDSYRLFSMPMFTIFLGLAKLTTGSVHGGDYEEIKTEPSAETRALRISDSTLAAIPASVGDQLQAFDEPEVGLISPKGLIYLGKIAEYTTRA